MIMVPYVTVFGNVVKKHPRRVVDDRTTFDQADADATHKTAPPVGLEESWPTTVVT